MTCRDFIVTSLWDFQASFLAVNGTAVIRYRIFNVSGKFFNNSTSGTGTSTLFADEVFYIQIKPITTYANILYTLTVDVYTPLSDDYSDTSVLVYGFGAGVSKTVDKSLDIYGGGVLSFFDGTYEPNFGSSYDFEASDNVSVFAGVEKSLQGQIKVGFELNLIHQTGFAAYIEMPF